MKNLPEKIYLNLGDLTEEEYNETDFQDLSEVTWSEDDVQGRNIKYVRKDAFIEKAVSFIRNCTSYDGLGYKAKCVNIEDFKKYMED